MKTKQSGFTLVEVLISIGILSVLGFLIATSLIGSLRGGNKSNIIGNIKQNGQNALSIMDQTIRSADKVLCPLPPTGSNTISDSPSIVVVGKDNKITRFTFVDQSGTSANGYIQQDSPTINPSSENDPAIICSTLPSNSGPAITDTNKNTGVSVRSSTSTGNGIFNITKSSGHNDLVTIQFDLKPGVSAPTSFDNSVGSTVGIHFTTTVEVR